jgi:hypothetical protein
MGRIFLVLFMFFILFDAVKYALNIDKYCFTIKHASVKYQGIEGSIKLNALSKAFINFARNYEPTLVVFPDPSMDSLANYFTSYSKIKSIDCLPENRYLNYEDKDLSKILVLLTSPHIDYIGYIKWAQDNNYNIFSEDRAITVAQRSNIRLPVRILLFSKNMDTRTRPDIKGLISISNP